MKIFVVNIIDKAKMIRQAKRVADEINKLPLEAILALFQVLGERLLENDIKPAEMLDYEPLQKVFQLKEQKEEEHV